MKYILLFILAFNILAAQEDDVKKASELELFLFKIGFESLLKDVESTKNKSDLNEQKLSNIKEQLKLIFDEVYKNKKNLSSSNLTNETTKNQEQNSFKEILFLKEEIKYLKEEIKELRKLKKNQKILIKTNSLTKSKKFKVMVNSALIKNKPTIKSEVIRKVFRNDYIEIISCDKFGWCKLKDENTYIPKFALKL